MGTGSRVEGGRPSHAQWVRSFFTGPFFAVTRPARRTSARAPSAPSFCRLFSLARKRRGLSPFARNRGMSPLKPAFLPRQPVRVDAVVRAEFADRFGKIVAHGAGRQAELLGDLRRGEALAGQAQCLSFAIV